MWYHNRGVARYFRTFFLASPSEELIQSELKLALDDFTSAINSNNFGTAADGYAMAAQVIIITLFLLFPFPLFPSTFPSTARFLFLISFPLPYPLSLLPLSYYQFYIQTLTRLGRPQEEVDKYIALAYEADPKV